LKKELAVAKKNLLEPSSESTVPGAGGVPTPAITSQPSALEPQRSESTEVPGAGGAPTPEITSQPFALEPQRRK